MGYSPVSVVPNYGDVDQRILLIAYLLVLVTLCKGNILIPIVNTIFTLTLWLWMPESKLHRRTVSVCHSFAEKHMARESPFLLRSEAIFAAGPIPHFSKAVEPELIAAFYLSKSPSNELDKSPSNQGKFIVGLLYIAYSHSWCDWCAWCAFGGITSAAGLCFLLWRWRHHFFDTILVCLILLHNCWINDQVIVYSHSWCDWCTWGAFGVITSAAGLWFSLLSLASPFVWYNPRLFDIVTQLLAQWPSPPVGT